MKNIAVICKGIAVRAFQDIYSGIKDCARSNNCNVFFIATDRIMRANESHEHGEYNVFFSVDPGLFDGVIFLNSTLGEDELPKILSERIKEAGIPAICIDGNYDGMLNLRIDNRSAIRDMITHMITEHNHKRISFVTGPLNFYEAHERFEAYKQTMEDFDLPYDDSCIFEGDFSPVAGRNAVEYFIKNQDKLPEAIVCSNDLMALGVIQSLDQKGIKVPEMVAVTGFDDMPQARYSEPRLTTISRENYKAGYAACQQLINGILPEEIGSVKALATNVIKRESCGCSAKDDFDYVQLRKNYFSMEDIYASYTTETRYLNAELCEVSSIETLKEKLVPFIKRIGCDEFYLCLLNEWDGLYSDNESAVRYGITELKDNYIKDGVGSGTYLAFGYATRFSGENSQFSVSNLIDILKERNLGRNSFIVTPVHFGDRFFGYSIISNCENAFNNQYYLMWIQGIGVSLELIRRQTVLNATLKKVDSLWIYDNLTGLYNRAGFNKYGNYIFKECAGNRQCVSLFYVDLDDLKHVNELYGHDIGDNFIKAMAYMLKKRKKHGEVIMRFGGDEFVILAKELDEEGAKEYCDSIYSEIEDYNKMHNLPSPLSATIKYNVLIPEEGASLDDAINNK